MYRSSPFRSTLNTGYITGLDMCKVCTEAVHSVALWKCGFLHVASNMCATSTMSLDLWAGKRPASINMEPANHPWKERIMIFQTSMLMFHVNLHGCICFKQYRRFHPLLCYFTPDFMQISWNSRHGSWKFSSDIWQKGCTSQLVWHLETCWRPGIECNSNIVNIQASQLQW